MMQWKLSHGQEKEVGKYAGDKLSLAACEDWKPYTAARASAEKVKKLISARFPVCCLDFVRFKDSKKSKDFELPSEAKQNLSFLSLYAKSQRVSITRYT